MYNIQSIANDVAKKRGITRTEARSVVQDVIDVILNAACTEGVSVRECFTIQPKLVKGRTGKSVSGETYTSKDHKILSIKTGKRSRELLNP